MTILLPDGTQFLDRDEQRATLIASLPPRNLGSGMRLVRGPMGVGKSSLVDAVCAVVQDYGHIVTVDPGLKGDVGEHRAYDGFFVQKIARALSVQLPKGAQSFTQYVKSRGWENLKGIKPQDVLPDLTSVTRGVKRALDIFGKLSGSGDYAPEQLLNSDQASAVAVCAAYVRMVLRDYPCVLVIREAHHFDLYSLKHIISILSEAKVFHPVLEYTCSGFTYHATHDATLAGVRQKLVWDIEELPWEYVLQLLDQKGQSSVEFVGKLKARWNGNLRQIDDMVVTIGVGPEQLRVDAANSLPMSALDYKIARLSALSPPERVVLACLVEHNEPMPLDVLEGIWAHDAYRRGMFAKLETVLDRLQAERLITLEGGFCSLSHDDVPLAAHAMPDAARYETDAKNWLLRLFLDQLETGAPGGRVRGHALRHGIRLAAQSRDTVLVLRLLTELQSDIAAKGSASPYIDAALASLSAIDGLSEAEQTALGEWAARTAYENSDFRRALVSIEAAGLNGPIWDCVVAHCQIEEGALDPPVDYAGYLQSEMPFDAAQALSTLILANRELVLRKYEACKTRLSALAVSLPEDQEVLRGHLHRLWEAACPADEALDHCHKSAEAFAVHGLSRSVAYSRLAMFRHLARTGRAEEALNIADEIRDELMQGTASRHFMMTNEAAAILLTQDPDPRAAEDLLRRAYLTSNDRFSDMVILQNTVIALDMQGRSETAVALADQLLALVEEKGATAKLLAPTACFTASIALREAGDAARADKVLQLPAKLFDMTHLPPYWAWRYGHTLDVPPGTPTHIAQARHHPVFLSQWQVDLEVLAALFPRSH